MPAQPEHRSLTIGAWVPGSLARLRTRPGCFAPGGAPACNRRVKHAFGTRPPGWTLSRGHHPDVPLVLSSIVVRDAAAVGRPGEVAHGRIGQDLERGSVAEVEHPR